MLTKTLLTTLFALASLLVLFTLGACSKGASSDAPVEVRWEQNDDENLAVPICPECGDVADHADNVCACGVHYTITETEIDCPDCDGAAACAHCAVGADGKAKHDCIGCDNSGHCPICDGSGEMDGDVCPECDGKKTCGPCEGAAKRVAAGGESGCAHCASTAKCANCEGTGKLKVGPAR